MSSDTLSLFSKFNLSRLPCRLSLEKNDGISAVQPILSLYLFRINGEMIHSIYKKNFYQLLTKTKYFVENKRHNVTELVAMYTRRTKCCRKYKCQYIELRGCQGNIPVMIYLIKYGRRQTWNIMLSTNLLMNFVRAFELYQIRWNIEVVNKETKEHLGLGSYMGCDFNGQIANAMLCYLTNTVMALEKRFTEYQTMGEHFSDKEVDLMALTLWKRVLACIEHILCVLGGNTWDDVPTPYGYNLR